MCVLDHVRVVVWYCLTIQVRVKMCDDPRNVNRVLGFGPKNCEACFNKM